MVEIMPVYKDNERGTYYTSFYYTDFNGERKKKKKRGFKLARDARQWEIDFLRKMQGDPGMSFESLVDIYLEDLKARTRPNTYMNAESHIRKHILPFFGKMPLNQIDAAMVRRWENEINTGDYTPGTLKIFYSKLDAIFNFAVKFYELPKNPCKQAGPIGTLKKKDFNFWTLDEYKQFISVVADPRDHVVFQTLYFTGCRIGEILAITPADVDTETGIININKTYHEKGHVVGPTKTESSNRVIVIPSFLKDELQAYVGRLYGIGDDDRIFDLKRAQTFSIRLRKYAEKAGVKPIRIHDLRHSHASLLIQLNFSPLVISQRLGHNDVAVTLNRYSHLYPNAADEVAEKLQELF